MRQPELHMTIPNLPGGSHKLFVSVHNTSGEPTGVEKELPFEIKLATVPKVVIPPAEVDEKGNVQLKFAVEGIQIPQQGLVRALINRQEAAVFDTAPGSLWVTEMMPGQHTFECVLLSTNREPLAPAENGSIGFTVAQRNSIPPTTSAQDPQQAAEEFQREVMIFSLQPMNEEQKRMLLSKYPVQQLFQRLSDGVTDPSSLCAVLDKIFDGPAGYQQLMADDFAPYLEGGLFHPHPAVRKLTLQQLRRLCTNEDGLILIVERQLAGTILSMLHDDNLGVVEDATACIVQLCKHPAGLSTFDAPQARATVESCLGSGANVRMRMMELFARMCAVGPEAFGVCKALGAQGALMQDVQDESDVLLRMNAIEMLPKLIGNEPDVSVLMPLLDMFCAEESNLGPSFLPVIARVISKAWQNTTEVPEELLIKLHSVLSSRLPIASHQEHVVCGLSVLSETEQGARLLASWGDVCNGLVELFGQTTKPDLQVALLFTFRSLVEHGDRFGADQLHSGSTIDKLFSVKDAMLRQCRTPSEDVRLATYRLLQALAASDWGIEKMASLPDFASCLEDTVMESSKTGKELKHAIAKQMLESSSLRKLFGPADYKVIQAFVQRGPFLTGKGGSESAPEVATLQQ
jgi:hypothetical protein